MSTVSIWGQQTHQFYVQSCQNSNRMVPNHLPAAEHLPQVLLDQPLDSSAHLGFHHGCLMPMFYGRCLEEPEVGSMYAVLGSLKVLTKPRMALPCLKGIPQCPVRQA